MRLSIFLCISAFAFCSMVISPPAFAGYLASLETNNLGELHHFYIKNQVGHPVRCLVRARNDAIWVELDVEGHTDPFHVPESLRGHELSISCRPISLVRKIKPWRVNHYQAGTERVHHNVFSMTKVGN